MKNNRSCPCTSSRPEVSTMIYQRKKENQSKREEKRPKTKAAGFGNTEAMRAKVWTAGQWPASPALPFGEENENSQEEERSKTVEILRLKARTAGWNGRGKGVPPTSGKKGCYQDIHLPRDRGKSTRKMGKTQKKAEVKRSKKSHECYTGRARLRISQGPVVNHPQRKIAVGRT